jgi:hypothetical protein
MIKHHKEKTPEWEIHSGVPQRLIVRKRILRLTAAEYNPDEEDSPHKDHNQCKDEETQSMS